MTSQPTRQTTLETTLTSDGARLVLKRQPNPGGCPVLLLHGLAVNADIWDLPEHHNADFSYRSLTQVLAERGFDVWRLNFRGHGQDAERSTPPEGQRTWSVDHLIACDLPAAIDHVRRATGREPFVMGSSMGALALAAYLLGAGFPDGFSQIVLHEAWRTERHAAIAGAVFLQLPAALRWPASVYDTRGELDWATFLRHWWRTDADRNYPFEIAARMGWLEAFVASQGGIPLDRMRPPADREAFLDQLPKPLGDAWRSMRKSVLQAGLQFIGTFTGHTQHRAEVILSGRRYVLDEINAGVLSQLAKGVRQGAFVSALGDADVVYSDFYDRIATPLLAIVGGRDRIANAEITRDVFYDRVASMDKQWQCFEQFAHGEFEAAPAATDQVYPRIVAWLAERDTGTAAA